MACITSHLTRHDMTWHHCKLSHMRFGDSGLFYGCTTNLGPKFNLWPSTRILIFHIFTICHQHSIEENINSSFMDLYMSLKSCNMLSFILTIVLSVTDPHYTPYLYTPIMSLYSMNIHELLLDVPRLLWRYCGIFVPLYPIFASNQTIFLEESQSIHNHCCNAMCIWFPLL